MHDSFSLAKFFLFLSFSFCFLRCGLRRFVVGDDGVAVDDISPVSGNVFIVSMCDGCLFHYSVDNDVSVSVGLDVVASSDAYIRS